MEREQSERIYKCIMARVEKMALLWRIWARSVLGCTAVASLLAGAWLYRDLASSGFIDSFWLAFSDSSAVFAYWKEFGFTLIEGLPFASLVASLSAVILFLGIVHHYYASPTSTYKKI